MTTDHISEDTLFAAFRASTARDLEDSLDLLKSAKCPDCAGDGLLPVGKYDVYVHYYKCSWCALRSKLTERAAKK